MQFYKAPDQTLHQIEPEFSYMLPPGSVPISEEEAQAILQAQAVPVSRTCTPLEFIERFTEDEQLAVVTAVMQVPALRLWYDKLMASQQVVEDDPRLAAGMQALVDSGLITAKRRDEVLSWS